MGDRDLLYFSLFIKKLNKGLKRHPHVFDEGTKGENILQHIKMSP